MIAIQMPPQEKDEAPTSGSSLSTIAFLNYDEDEAENQKNNDSFIIHPTTSLPILIMIDGFSVALVVPLLNQYYQDAGVTSASLRELLSSLFSTSQIIGALVMGALSDSGILSRKHILYVSFLGSALSYSLIVYGGMKGLIVSRVVVGAVKQTSTISTSMISTYTTKQERSRYMGRISACATAAFIIGPSVGAYLYKNVDKKAPALLAAILFVLNFILAAILLPEKDEQKEKQIRQKSEDNEQKHKPSKANKFTSFAQNLKACFTSQELTAVVICSLLYHWVLRATSYASMASFYEEMFSIEPHQRGYLSSYQSTLSLLFQTFFVQSALRFFGGDYRAACAAAAGVAIATTLELGGNFYIFLVLICPIIAVANSLLSLSLRSLVTQIAPPESLGSVLAALDVMRNAASVSVPFYRTILFRLLACTTDEDSQAAMLGDPCPRMWLKSSLLHWVVATIAMGRLLLRKHDAVKKDD